MARRNKRPRIIGPFFLIAIVLSAGWFLWQKQQQGGPPRDAAPPVVERQVIDAGDSESVPSPDVVRSNATALGLKAEQLRRLDPVAQAYENELEPLQAQTQTAVQRFQGYQESKQGQKQVPTAEIQEQMAEIGQLSGRMVSLRQRYWEATAPILTPSQRAQALDLWRQRLSRHGEKEGTHR
jgi:hypothetical protein